HRRTIDPWRWGRIPVIRGADEVFRDANWMPSGYEKKERMGISIAKGIESMSTS
ncbi:unnamed protein product, partial [Urochloa humidicola]